MMLDWNLLSDEAQLALSQAAFAKAAATIAHHAEVLAGEMENGALSDRGGPEALRLLAAVVRVTGRNPQDDLPEGHG
jgi:hypothetical protein